MTTPEKTRSDSGPYVYEVEVSIRETGTRFVEASNAREAAEKVRRGESLGGYSGDDAYISGIRSVRRADPADLDFLP